MYKVLIVDDESWVVESLKDLIDWEKYGFEVAGQAANGGEALDAIQAIGPDVVFTDIRMPEMSGLELIRRAKAHASSIRFVVASGYAEFAYAQKALTYGAVAYCLKPFDEIEIGGVLAKLKEVLDAEGHHDIDALQALLDDPDTPERDSLLEVLRKQGVLDWLAQGVVPIAVIGRGDVPFPAGRRLELRTGTAKSVHLIGKSAADGAAARWHSAMPEGVSGIGVGTEANDWRTLRSAMEDADAATYQFFLEGRPGLFKLHAPDEAALDEWMVKVQAAIAERNNKAAAEALDRIGELLGDGRRHLSIRHAYKVYNMTVSFLYNLGKRETILYGYEQLVRSFADVGEMMAELKATAEACLKQSAAPAPESRNQTFNAILHFVTDNFRKDMSLQELSELFFMNPSYISQLFKKEVGETFTAYVAGLRIKHACEQLAKSGDSVQEIAEKVGYRDYFYFTRLFKKLTGLTPTQYREHNS